MKPCNRICDVANDGICMGICAMGLSNSGFKVAEHSGNVYLLHDDLNGSLATIHATDRAKVASLHAFVNASK